MSKSSSEDVGRDSFPKRAELRSCKRCGGGSRNTSPEPTTELVGNRPDWLSSDRAPGFALEGSGRNRPGSMPIGSSRSLLFPAGAGASFRTFRTPTDALTKDKSVDTSVRTRNLSSGPFRFSSLSVLFGVAHGKPTAASWLWGWESPALSRDGVLLGRPEGPVAACKADDDDVICLSSSSWLSSSLLIVAARFLWLS